MVIVVLVHCVKNESQVFIWFQLCHGTVEQTHFLVTSIVKVADIPTTIAYKLDRKELIICILKSWASFRWITITHIITSILNSLHMSLLKVLYNVLNSKMRSHGKACGPDATAQTLFLWKNIVQTGSRIKAPNGATFALSTRWTVCETAALNASKHIMDIKWHNCHLNFILLFIYGKNSMLVTCPGCDMIQQVIPLKRIVYFCVCK